MSKEIAVQLNIKSPPAAVFKALTESAQLQTWFAEHAEIDLSKNMYDFWGKHTPECPTREDGNHKIVKIAENANLSYDWHLRGHDTTVTIDLEDANGITQLVVKHSGLSLLKPWQSSIIDYWGHVLELLRLWVEQKITGERFDYCRRLQGNASLSVEINGPNEKVFDALINPRQLERYIAGKDEAKVDPKIGGVYDFGWGDGPIKILDIVPNEKLSYSWQWGDEEDTIVTWTLQGSGGTTRLNIVHSGFRPDRDAESYNVGWWKFLYRIKWMIEGGADWEMAKSVGKDWV